MRNIVFIKMHDRPIVHFPTSKSHGSEDLYGQKRDCLLAKREVIRDTRVVSGFSSNLITL